MRFRYYFASVLVAAGAALAGAAEFVPAPGEFLSNIPYEKYIRIDAETPAERVFNVKDFGAVGNASTLNTEAINKAILAAHEAGGGTVLIEGGDFVSGTILLQSKVTLRIARDSILRASRNIQDFTPQPSFIYCEDAHGVRIEGPGRIAGEGDAWWEPPRAIAPVSPPPVFDLVEMKAMHFAAKRHKKPGRPSPFIRLAQSLDVEVSNLVIENSPGWTLMLDHCTGARVEGVVINSNYHGGNTDGIDVVGSSKVVVTRCFISTGDDGIVLKNGFAKELSRPMQNIEISHCAIRSAANGIKIGTETWSDISDVRISDCEIFTEEIWPWTLAAIAIESVDGAHVRNIRVSNITARNVTCPLLVRLGNRNRWKDKDRAGTLEGIVISDFTATNAEFPCIISGLPGMPVKNVSFGDINIRYRDTSARLHLQDPVPEMETEYPEFWMFGDLPAFGFFFRHVDGLDRSTENVIPRRDEQRPPVFIQDVTNESCSYPVREGVSAEVL